MVRESHEHQDEVTQPSCLVGETATEEPFCAVLASNLRKKPRIQGTSLAEMGKRSNLKSEKKTSRITDGFEEDKKSCLLKARCTSV